MSQYTTYERESSVIFIHDVPDKDFKKFEKISQNKTEMVGCDLLEISIGKTKLLLYSEPNKQGETK